MVLKSIEQFCPFTLQQSYLENDHSQFYIHIQ